MWSDIVAHPNYDAYWSARNLLPHLKHVAPAVMTVGGWFDAEDLYGALNTYRAIEYQNPNIYNVLVMGPWQHGGWSRTDGDRLGNARFGEKTSLHYRKDMELAFFEHFLKDANLPLPAEANVFDTGANVWRTFDAWPPKSAKPSVLSLDKNFKLDLGTSNDSRANEFDEFISDPAHPVPFTDSISISMTREYMTDDQRFVATRPDVLCYRTPPLEQDVTIAGPILAQLQVSTSGTDSDWIVKVIDEFPPDAADPKDADALSPGEHQGGFQMLVRSEVMRGRFRDDPSKPKPFVPDVMTSFTLPLQDVLHTFKKGHRIQVQIHCTWFPLVDRNPQTFVPSIYAASASDFVAARQRVWDGTRLDIAILPAAAR
jgi:putative CocE/NonD family hydrolase